MNKRLLRVSALIAFALLLSASVAMAEDEKKRGFHGWGDSQESAAREEASKTEPEAATAESGQAEKSAESRREYEYRSEVTEKIQKEREAFFDDTEDLRREIYQKRLELRSELAKSEPSERRARSLQEDIAGLREELDQKRLEHFIRMKKIDPQMGRRGAYGRRGYGACPNCPYQGRGYGEGYHMMGPGYGGHMMGPGYGGHMMGPGYGGHMMGPGYGRHHMWDRDDGRWSKRKGDRRGWSGSKSSPRASRPSKDVSQSDARAIVEDYIASTRNPNLKAGKISDAGDAYHAEIVTKEGSLVDEVLVDKQSGYMRPAY